MRFQFQLFVIVCLAVTIEARPNSDEWVQYKLTHNKVYQDDQEDAMRMDIYFKNKKFIEEFNAKSDFQLGINHLSDWTEAELEQNHGRRPPVNQMNGSGLKAQKYIDSLLINNTISERPSSFDWRKTKGVVSSVKNQGKCASDWAFTATGALEGQMLKRGANKMVDLSSQYLIDCDDFNYGCTSGNAWDAMKFVAERKGIQADSSYPYNGHKGVCRDTKSKSVFTCSGTLMLWNRDPDLMMTYIWGYGPVAVAINVSSKDLKIFAQYKSGIYKSEFCRKFYPDLNRSLLLVGYGTDPKEGDYWIVKNSMGENWGENGYMRMPRDLNNMCGILTEPIVPVYY